MSDQLVAKLQSYMRRAASHPAVADSEVVLSLPGEYERESVQVDVAVKASFEERRAAEEGWRLPVGVSAEFLKFVGERLIPPRPNQQFQDVSIADLVGQPDRVLVRAFLHQHFCLCYQLHVVTHDVVRSHVDMRTGTWLLLIGRETNYVDDVHDNCIFSSVTN